MIEDNNDVAAPMRATLDAWLAEVGAKFPVKDPEYDPEKERARLHKLENELMAKLEKQHAEYLDADWEPDPEWWGSNVTRD